MSTRTPLTRRVIALLVLPCFSAACTSWQPLRVSNLRDTMRDYRNLSTTMGHSTGLIREQCPVW